MTIGYIVVLVIVGLLGIAFAVFLAVNDDEPMKVFFATMGLTIIVVGIMWSAGNWYYGSTAAGIRAVKDQESNLNNGLNREIIIEAADGRRVFYYKGKCDIESDHTDNYILFEGEDGLRRMVYYGITDTVLILETGE